MSTDTHSPSWPLEPEDFGRPLERLRGGESWKRVLEGLLVDLPEERADYFLDPWNSPYWIRHRCSSKRQRITIYSFGPNRRRDSDSRELRGDDIGAVIELAPAPSED